MNNILIHFKFNKITKLDKPWGSTFINNDQILVTEKGGKIKLINIKKKDIKIIDHNLNFLEHGQGGLLDIIYKDDVVWISYTENRGNWKTSTSIAKGLFDEEKIKYLPTIILYHNGDEVVRVESGISLKLPENTIELIEDKIEEIIESKF